MVFKPRINSKVAPVQQRNFQENQISKRILQSKSAYAIMPVGKKRLRVHLDKERIPQLYASTVEGFFFSFIAAKPVICANKKLKKVVAFYVRSMENIN